jgi:hypothetical protein
MKSGTTEWIKFAERDYEAAKVLAETHNPTVLRISVGRHRNQVPRLCSCRCLNGCFQFKGEFCMQPRVTNTSSVLQSAF